MTSDTAAPESPPRAGLTIFIICLALLIVPLGLSGSPVALPAIGQDLHAGVVPLQWVVNAYNVMAASSMMAAGAIADQIGRKKVFGFGIALYGLSSLGAALAQNIVLVDIARGLAGVAAGAVMTAGASVMANMFQGAARAKAFTFVGVTIGAGLALGPTLSGMLVSSLGWRSVFLLQVAITVVALLGFGLVEDSRNPEATGVDRPGTVTFSLALFLFTLAIIQGPQWGWGSGATLGLFLGCVVMLAAFIVVERRAAQPMFDLSLFRDARFVGVNLLATAVSFGFVGLMVLLPSYLVGSNGASDNKAGLTLLMMTAPVFVFPLIAGKLVAAGVALRNVLSGALLLVAIGCGWLTVIHPGIGSLGLLGPLVVIGIGIGLIFGLMDGAAVSTVPATRVGMATGMFNTIRLASEAVAVAGMVAAMVSLVQSKVSDGLDRFAGAPDAHAVADSVTSGNSTDAAEKVTAGSRTEFLDFLSQGHTDGLRAVLWGAAAICAVTAVILFAVLKDRKDAGQAAAGEAGEIQEADKITADA
ncbi:MFS transporter [Streptomyces sp. NPDC059002]|uniref:MFS transporter n=1 Tax=Streptomyces sp. NPDC059002 TaxID=3346690 RepID=UPI0036BD4420